MFVQKCRKCTYLNIITKKHPTILHVYIRNIMSDDGWFINIGWMNYEKENHLLACTFTIFFVCNKKNEVVDVGNVPRDERVPSICSYIWNALFPSIHSVVRWDDVRHISARFKCTNVRVSFSLNKKITHFQWSTLFYILIVELS